MQKSMTAEHEHFPDPHHDAEANVVFGFWVYLMTDFILFATLFAAYAVLRDGTAGGISAKDFRLPYALVETVVLLASALACGLASLGLAEHRKNKVIGYYALTFVLGALFLGMVLSEFSELTAAGHTWQKSAFLSSYFTLVGTHALHIAVGLLFTAVLMIQVAQRGIVPVTIRRLTCLKLFWLFSYLVWVFMFSFVYLMGARY